MTLNKSSSELYGMNSIFLKIWRVQTDIPVSSTYRCETIVYV